MENIGTRVKLIHYANNVHNIVLNDVFYYYQTD